MGAFITLGIVCVGIFAGVAIYNALPTIMNFVRSLINWNSY